MSEISEMIMLGIACSNCRCNVDGDEVGYPRFCTICDKDEG